MSDLLDTLELRMQQALRVSLEASWLGPCSRVTRSLVIFLSLVLRRLGVSVSSEP